MPLTARAERELSELISSPIGQTVHYAPVRDQEQHRQPLATSGFALAAAIALTLVAVIIQLHPTPAHATPLPLQFHPMNVSSKELLTTLSNKISAIPETSNEQPIIRIQTWNMVITDAGEETTPTAIIVPGQLQVVRHRDGSLTNEMRTGQPVNAAGNPIAGDADTPPIGTLLWSATFTAEQLVFPTPAPTTAQAMGNFLRQAIPENTPTNSGEYFRVITALLREQDLTSEQNSALLQFLASRTDIEVAGSVTDRLGRDGVAIRATRYWFEDAIHEYLIFDPNTGQIIATETVDQNVEHLQGLTGPTVTGYHAWERNQTK